MDIENAITVDVEDWYHVCGLERLPQVPSSSRRVVRNTQKILALLDGFGVKGTFFVLGSVAEAEPGLVPEIAAAGHEIASHGWSHALVYDQGPAAFRDEIRRTADLLESQCGHRPVGFRAPQWSLGHAPWAFPILAEEGCRYDSSLNPLPFVGDTRGSRTPYRRAEGLLEFPPLVTHSVLGNLPTGGGWGFRFFPARLIERGISGLNRQNAPAVLYLHPRELDPEGPRLPLPALKSFAAYGPRRDAADRLSRLLAGFRFTTLDRLADTWDSAF